MNFSLKWMLILFLFMFHLNISAQELYEKQAIYKMTFQPDSNDVESKNTMEMELLINDNNSLFQSLKQRQKDSVVYFHEPDLANKTSYGGGIILKPINKFSYKIIKENDVIKVYDSAFGLNMDGKDVIYTYEEFLDSLDWQIREDTIHFANSICQRADLVYGGRTWKAWFALDIPIFDGPYKFGGLPGLIVKISDEKRFWDFELTSLNTVSLKHAINFQQWFIFEEKSKEELYRDRLEFQENMPVWTADSKPENPADKEFIKDYLEKLKPMIQKDNNWIELPLFFE